MSRTVGDGRKVRFGLALRGHRQAAGLKQAELAEQMAAAGHRWHGSTVSKCEAGDRDPSLTELGDLADHYEDLKAMGVEVYSVSTDSHFVHKAWHAASDEVGKVQYFMLGDSNLELTRNFEVERLGSGQADRATFLIDPQGTIQYIEQTAEGIGRSAAELLRKVKAAQYVAAHPGEVCPAKWEEGEETLTPSIDLVGKI